MKMYDIWYITKQNGHGNLHHYITMPCKNQRDAKKELREVMSNYGVHAFSVSFKPFELSADGKGVVYNGIHYHRAYYYKGYFVLW